MSILIILVVLEVFLVILKVFMGILVILIVLGFLVILKVSKRICIWVILVVLGYFYHFGDLSGRVAFSKVKTIVEACSFNLYHFLSNKDAN